MSQSRRVADQSRDSHLLLRRVERQQRVIEVVSAARVRVTLGRLADTLGVSERTAARDVQRLRLSGVPFRVTPGRGGGVELDGVDQPVTVRLNLPQLAALLSSLAALGPTATDSAASAMRVLLDALTSRQGDQPDSR